VHKGIEKGNRELNEQTEGSPQVPHGTKERQDSEGYEDKSKRGSRATVTQQGTRRPRCNGKKGKRSSHDECATKGQGHNSSREEGGETRRKGQE